MRSAIGLVVLAAIPLSASAANVWTPVLSDWKLHLDNGVAYISATNMPQNCSFSRAQIETSSNISTATYQRDIYAYVLAAYAAGKSMKIVINDTETTCKVYGANDNP